MGKNKKRPKSWHRVTDGKRYKKAMGDGLTNQFNRIAKEQARAHQVWSTGDRWWLFVSHPCTCRIRIDHWSNGESL